MRWPPWRPTTPAPEMPTPGAAPRWPSTTFPPPRRGVTSTRCSASRVTTAGPTRVSSATARASRPRAPDREPLVPEPVLARSADHQIAAVPADQQVLASAPGQLVVAGPALDQIVSGAGAH